MKQLVKRAEDSQTMAVLLTKDWALEWSRGPCGVEDQEVTSTFAPQYFPGGCVRKGHQHREVQVHQL